MEIFKQFIAETNYVVGRLLQEYNSFDAPGEEKWALVSGKLSDFIQEVKTDERIPMIVGASTVSALHKAYMTGTFKLFMHEINMHLMALFSSEDFAKVRRSLGSAYYSAMRCNEVGASSVITEEDAAKIFFDNPWLITLYLIRMNYFTPIVTQLVSMIPNET